MPGIISPSGAYSRSRSPRPVRTGFSASAMPKSIWNSTADGGRPYFCTSAKARAMERTLCEPTANFTPPSPARRGAAAMNISAIRSKHASVCRLCVQTGTGQPSCSARIAS